MGITEKVMAAFFMVFFGAALGLFLVYIPVAFYTEAQCLRDGYPKSAVTIGLERYCMNLDGSVTVKVDKAGAPR